MDKNNHSVILKQLNNDLTRLGLSSGVILLVHASMRSLGIVTGGAETVVSSLLEAIGPGGTLLMPALSYETVGPSNPIFNLMNTPSCVGALPEYFRTRPGTTRSVHPTHSVCATGSETGRLLGEHHLDSTPCGKHSPFYKLREVGGQVLFLGCGLQPNTSMHAIEEIVLPPYLFAEPVDYKIILPLGKTRHIRVRNHDFEGWEQRYDRLGALLEENGMQTGKILAANAVLVDCQTMWEAALKALKTDPFYFVEEVR